MKVTLLFRKVDMEADWDEEYLTHVGYFSHVNGE